MPYKTRRKYRGKKKAKGNANLAKWANTGAKVATTAYKAYQLASKIARVVNVEYKYKQSNYSQLITSDGNIINLIPLAQGNDTDQRTGDSVKLMRISGRSALYLNPDANESLVRCIIFRGKNERGSSYSVTGPDVPYILSSEGNLKLFAPKSHDQQFASKILYDKTYSLSQNGKSVISLDWNFKLYGHTQYKGSDGTVIEDGGLYLLLISEQAEPTTQPTFVSTLKTTFTDN